MGAKLVGLIVFAAVLGGLIGSVATLVLSEVFVDDNARIAEFYATENAVHVSPHGIRNKIGKGQSDFFVLVDLRSAQEYEKSHIVSALNVPAYKDPDTSAYGDVDRIVASFEKIERDNPGKDIIVYCYSVPCMTGRKVGKMLAERGIFVKHLNVGWNDWKAWWNVWNHEHETALLEDYLYSGSEPGVFSKVDPSAKNLCGPEELGC
ncbi:MAG: rhodanese-like domain-containing protein [Candidatus Micrarchaeia archaeon]